MEKVNANNSKNQEEIQTSKGKKKNKRELPSPPVPEDISSYIQEDVDTSKSKIAFKPEDVGGGKEPKRKSKKDLLFCCHPCLSTVCQSRCHTNSVLFFFFLLSHYVWNCVGKGKGATAAKAEQLVEDAEDKLLHDYQQQIVQEEERNLKKTMVKTEEETIVSQKMTLNNDSGKKKKKKLKSVNTEAEIGCVYLLI